MVAEPQEARTPNGCMTGLAKEIELAIGRCELSGKTGHFLSMLKVLSFGNAGWQHGPHSGLWCFFDLAAWCQELKASKTTVIHIRLRLEADGILSYEQKTGKLFWNPNIQEWKPLQADYVRWGGNRRKQEGIALLKGQQVNIADLKQEREKRSREQCTVGESASREQCQLGKNTFKRAMDASSEVNAQQGAIDEPKKGTEEKITEEEGRIAPIDAAQGRLFPVIEQILPIAPQQQEAPQAPPAKRARPRDELWDAAARVFGFSPEGSAAGLWGKKLSLMRKRSVPVTPEELPKIAAAYQQKYPNATFSLAALESHVDDLRIFIQTGGNHARTNGHQQPGANGAISESQRQTNAAAKRILAQRKEAAAGTEAG